MKLNMLMTGTILSGFLAASAVTAQELVVLDWSGYEDEGFLQSYIAKHGGPPTYSFFGEEEEAFQKLRSGFKADVSHPCSQSVSKWLDAGLIEPIDPAKIERWDEVNAGMKEAFKFDGEYYLIPSDWGTTALTYRSDLVDPAAMDTLEVFKDPKYAGRIALPDNVDDVYALAYLATGTQDWSKATDEDFAKANEWLRAVHPMVRAYWADGAELAQLMTSGEVIVAWAWNETPTTLAGEDIPVEANRETKEGSSTWFCGYVNLKDGPNDEALVYDFFNTWLSPETTQYIVNEWGYGSGNEAQMASLGTEALEGAGLGEINVPILAQIPMDQQLREKMIAEFEKIKAGF
ncbi:extracellular solute-binding protein [Neptunicoccus cionae]|uniref:extracellular solute-binding protein n=1 Tax=Neptunicoccus cionae TaxID=2035344 RepID=UPI000C75F753|nr:extracellular solute-binding protein [Amylibacter cionae]PLS22999.1 polyamine ABC transporter substrate-binding protein [Amylibacter cionae]